MSAWVLVVIVLAAAGLGAGCSAKSADGTYASRMAVTSATGPVPSRSASRPTAIEATPAGTKEPHPARGLQSAAAAALAEARVVCAFDWRQSLWARGAAARRFATPAYAQLISPSSVGSANWAGTQADREAGVCTAMAAALLRDAPNTATVRFIRVRAVQSVTVGGKPAGRQTFAVVYRTERQPSGGWLVGGLSGGD